MIAGFLKCFDIGTSNWAVRIKLRIERVYSHVRAWFQDHLVNRMFRNAGYLLGGDLLASVMRMITIALTARALGVESFGMLVLLQTYVAIIDRVVNFQSWQALIKYGAEHLSNGQHERLNDIFKLGFLVDLSTALIGSIVAASLASWAGFWLQWSDIVVEYAVFYSAVIAFNIEGTCIAVLRLHDKFAVLGSQKVVAAGVKLVATAVAFATTSSFVVFVSIAAVCQVVGYLVLIGFSFWQLRALKLRPIRKGSATRALRENRGVVTYILTTNVHATFRMIPDQLDFLIVSTFLGNAATGVYKVAKETARILTRLVQPLYQSVYPELATLSANRQYGRIFQIVKRSSAIVGLVSIGFWIGLVLFGESLLALLFGEQFASGYSVLVWYAFGAAMSAAAFPITPAVLAIGLPKLPLFVIIASTLIYVASLPLLLMLHGLPGAGMANVVFYGSWIVLMGLGSKLILGRDRRIHDRSHN